MKISNIFNKFKQIKCCYFIQYSTHTIIIIFNTHLFQNQNKQKKILNKLINNENTKFYLMDFERGWILIVYQYYVRKKVTTLFKFLSKLKAKSFL